MKIGHLLWRKKIGVYSGNTAHYDMETADTLVGVRGRVTIWNRQVKLKPY